MRATLKKYWGYDDFRPLQADIIQSILDGHDTLGLLPTGGGKSITFQVPALMLPGLAIVVTPLISLMKDQVDNLLQRRVRAYCLHSGMSRAESRLALDKCRLGKAKLLYVSPERLQSERFIGEIRDWNVSMIVVDEAHCISQWGYDFRPSYLNIRSLRELFPQAPVLALTASATPAVADDIMRQLGFRPGWQRFAKSFSRSNLSYVVRMDDYKERSLLRVLAGVPGTAIVYVRSRKRCRELAQMLEQHGVSASFYHAGLDPEIKEERQNAWKDGEVRVMVATNAFGMGIDKADVRVVVHYDLPTSLEEYYQEAGRAGRDGLPSYAVVIANKRDNALLSKRLADSFPSKEYILKVYEAAGNFLELAVGSGYDMSFSFDFDLFCQRFKLQPAMAHSALKILTQAGYLDYSDEVSLRSRVMILADKREFYSLRLDPVADRVFAELQRMYTGMFADFVPISEPAIARRAEASEQQVYETLLMLSRMKVISYVPKQTIPLVYFPTSREEPRHVVIPRSAYEDRRQAMADRIEAMRRFVFDAAECRVQSMLRYFGEVDAPACGTCDVCRASRSASRPSPVPIDVTIDHLASRGGSVAELLSIVGPARKDEAVAALRRMADEGKVAVTATGVINMA